MRGRLAHLERRESYPLDRKLILLPSAFAYCVRLAPGNRAGRLLQWPCGLPAKAKGIVDAMGIADGKRALVIGLANDKSLAWTQSVTSCRVGGLLSSGHAMG